MTSKDTKARWEQRLNEAGAAVEEELRRVVRYIDAEVVPEVRRNGSTALRTAADQLRKLAERMDTQAAGSPEPPSAAEPPSGRAAQ